MNNINIISALILNGFLTCNIFAHDNYSTQHFAAGISSYLPSFVGGGEKRNQKNENIEEEQIVSVDASVQAPNPVSPRVLSFADIIEPALPTVVNIYTIKHGKKFDSRRRPSAVNDFNQLFEQFNMPFFREDLFASSARATSLGSGVIISQDGLILTNNHVIAGSDEINVKLHDNQELKAEIIGVDPRTDIALLKIKTDKKLQASKFGDSSKARVGDFVIAIGNSLGFGGTVTSGIISSNRRDLGTNSDELVDDFLQTDAAINSGNSGGPLLNMRGEIIGINTAIPAIGGGTNVGIGFAIPSNTVKNIAEKLKKHGKVERGRLEIIIQELDGKIIEALGLQYDYGVLIADIIPGGTGAKAGLQRGDLIIEFNGSKVTTSRQLQLMVADCEIGQKISLAVVRDGKKIILSTILLGTDITGGDKKDKSSDYLSKNDNDQIVEISGIKIGNITPEIAQKFGLDDIRNKEEHGVIILENNNNVLGRIGLRPGDIIVSINKQKVYNVAELKKIHQASQKNGKKNIVLLIKRKNTTIFVALPA